MMGFRTVFKQCDWTHFNLYVSLLSILFIKIFEEMVVCHLKLPEINLLNFSRVWCSSVSYSGVTFDVEFWRITLTSC